MSPTRSSPPPRPADTTFVMISSVQQNLIDAQLRPARVGSEIATAVAGKALDAQRQEGAAAVELLDSAAQACSGGDPLVAKATGLGSLLDITA